MDPDGWLTVNVWSPSMRGKPLPVMVWIYGGAYMSGGTTNPAYDGTTMARDGNAVLVTFNYRLGAEGFAHIRGAPANRGLLDQIAALRWVRDNIAAFGGDPGQVTVFGQSAGGGAVAALMAMPAAAGLFRRAIVQSLPRPYLSPRLASTVTAELATSLTAKPSRTALANIPPPELAAAGDVLTRRLAQFAGRWGQLAYAPSPFAPVVDGSVLPQDPWQALRAGASRDVPLITGHTRDEYRLFTALSGQLGRITGAQAARALHAFAPAGDGAAYRAGYPQASSEDLYELVNSDWLFRMPSLALAQAHAAGGGHTYLYELSRPASGHGGLPGAPHGADVPLIFGNYVGQAAELIYGPRPPDATRALGDAMRAAWTAFARTGDPGWAAFTPADLTTYVYDARRCQSAPYPEETSRQLWQHQPMRTLDL